MKLIPEVKFSAVATVVRAGQPEPPKVEVIVEGPPPKAGDKIVGRVECYGPDGKLKWADSLTGKWEDPNGPDKHGSE